MISILSLQDILKVSLWFEVVLQYFSLLVIRPIPLSVNRHVTQMVNYALSRFSGAAAVVYTIL